MKERVYTIEVTCIITANSIERVVTIDGIDKFRDKRDSSIPVSDDDPIRKFELFLMGEQSECRG
jgi:hypothetical protein